MFALEVIGESRDRAFEGQCANLPFAGRWLLDYISLRTDQVGTGIDMGHALADLIRGVDGLLELAREDETMAYLREAPADIQARAAASKNLPREIYEVAHKIARGDWPEGY